MCCKMNFIIEENRYPSSEKNIKLPKYTWFQKKFLICFFDILNLFSIICSKYLCKEKHLCTS